MLVAASNLLHRGIIFLMVVSFLFGGFLFAENRTFVGQDLPDRETLFQVSTMNALLSGVFEGDKTIGELKKHGDFGIGAMHRLDGEMIALDGEFFQIKHVGWAFPVSDLMKTPFAAVTFFDEDEFLTIEDGPVDFAAVRKILDDLIVNKDIFYAIRIDGEFEFAKTRSVPSQKKPYRKLDEVLKNEQKIRDLKNVEGTMVGFWYPRYVGGINVPGYHFHFITKDRTRGGHLLDCSLIKGEVRIDRITQIHIELLESINRDTLQGAIPKQELRLLACGHIADDFKRGVELSLAVVDISALTHALDPDLLPASFLSFSIALTTSFISFGGLCAIQTVKL